MIQSSAAARADNSYTLRSIKGADMKRNALTKRRKKKEKARAYTEWEGVSCHAGHHDTHRSNEEHPDEHLSRF